MKFILLVVWWHFNTPTISLEFDSQAACEVARQTIERDIEDERVRLEWSYKKDNPTMTYNPRVKSYCLQK